MSLEQRAQEATNKGEVVKTECGSSKDTCLDLISRNKADGMSVKSLLGGMILIHTAVRFNDRALGEEVRRHTMEGFDLIDKSDNEG